jgi:hypothetical protein
MTFGAVTLAAGTQGSYPSLAATATGVITAWMTPGESGSRVAIAHVP